MEMGKIEKVEALAQKGKADKLIKFTRDTDKQVVLAAVRALGDLAGNEDALNALVGMMEHEDAGVRKEVVTAIGKSNGSYVKTQLMYCVGHEKDAQVLQAAKEALANRKE